jgi:methionyl aminopeptidase
MSVTKKTAAEIRLMRRAGAIVAEVLGLMETELRAGVSTAYLDEIAERHIRDSGAVPSFKGYDIGRGVPRYPASICISIDKEVVHGIPGERIIETGQVVSIDAGAIWQGWHGDAARTFIVGDVPDRARGLVEATRLGLMAGIQAARPGAYIGDISAAVQAEASAGKWTYGIVTQYVGHGIGTRMHEEPQVPNYVTPGYRGMQLEPGHCLAIEPMFTEGKPDCITLPDKWTVITEDEKLAAHFEHTIAITADGPEILTTV